MLFGKTLENVRDRVNLDFISHTQTQQKINRQSKLIFNGIANRFENFITYKYEKEKMFFDKPIYLEFTILELGKLLMYDFYHNTPRPYWQDQVKLR